MLLALVGSVESPTMAIVVALPRLSWIVLVFWNFSRCSEVSRVLRVIEQAVFAPYSVIEVSQFTGIDEENPTSIMLPMIDRVKTLEHEVSNLSERELKRFAKWFADYQDRLWVKQMERDAKAGKLDFLIEEAKAEH